MLYKEKIITDETGKSLLLRYYIIKSKLNPETNREEWGIKIESDKEIKEIRYLTPDYNQAKIIIALLADNDVTPVSLLDVVGDMM